MKKYYLLFLLVLLTGCSNNTETSTSPAPGFENVDEMITTSTKEFDIIAKQWDFEPSTIEVNQGDNVILNIKSIDVDHGIRLPEFGVNSFLKTGETTKIEFTADRKGSFRFFCSVYCGSGHSHMDGNLIVI